MAMYSSVYLVLYLVCNVGAKSTHYVRQALRDTAYSIVRRATLSVGFL